MKNNETLYYFIIDRSGSMESCMEETVKAYNDQWARLRELQLESPEQEFYLSLTIFNHKVDHVIDHSRLLSDRGNYIKGIQTSGTTALLDAIGSSIERINDQFGDRIEMDKMSVVMMILTDGLENASRRFTYRNIAAMIKKFEGTGKWSFSILGADIDVFSMAEKMNMSRENVIAFDKSDIHSVFNEYSSSMVDYVKEKREGRIKKDVLDSIQIKDKRRT